MSIALTSEAEAKVRERVESGRYASVDAVIGEALRLLEEHEQAKVERLRALIDEGFEGPFTPLTRESWMEGLARAKQRYEVDKKRSPVGHDVVSADAAS